MKKFSIEVIKELKEEFAKLKPLKFSVDGKREVSVKEIIFAMAPAMQRLLKVGYEYTFLLQRLQAKGISISERTLKNYLKELQRSAQKPDRKNASQNTAPAQAAGTEKLTQNTQEQNARQTNTPQPLGHAWKATHQYPNNNL